MAEVPTSIAQLVLSIDDQYLSGDPGALRPAVDQARQRGVQLCLEVSDFGRSSLESLIVLRPDVVRLAPDLTRRAAQSRSRRGVLARLVNAAHALGVTVWATGVDRHDDREWLAEQGVALASGWAAPSTG
jgi:EAL domain-containing protein (putative c-di-GMP-specific phosphodiesterase class I)